MTGKPHSFALQYGTFHSLYQTDFGAHLKNIVPNTLALRCISVDYTRFCEGCESKKCKNAGCARTRTRERGVKDEDWEHQKCFSEVRIILLQASNKNIGRFPKNVGLFPKNVGDFSQNVGDFSQNVGDFFEYLPRNLSVLQDSIENHARFPILTTNISPKELCPVRLSPSVQHKLKY